MLTGIRATLVEIEVDITTGLPAFTIVGLPDTAIKESRERVKAALRNGGFKFPSRKITINMAPAHLRKEGAFYDLPVAVGLLCAEGIIPQDVIKEYVITGELSLDGSIRPVRGILSIALAAREKGFKGLIGPVENAPEAALIDGIHIYGVHSLTEVVNFLTGRLSIKPYRSDKSILLERRPDGEDMKDVKGQEAAKRALEVAAAGGHNLLMIGPPGSGKTMLARRLPTILPDPSLEEVIEITMVYSLVNRSEKGLHISYGRPFRAPHHTISCAGMAGGGNTPRPGEISLAHNGVLFLDELPEYRRDVLEILRQPLEEGCISISRAGYTISYPARFMLVCAMNPCPCGFLGDERHECACTPLQIHRYRSKISGPLLDRIDIHIEVPPVDYRKLSSGSHSESSAEIKKRVLKARNIQRERFRKEKITCNREIPVRNITRYCNLTKDAENLLNRAMDSLGFSARAYTRILKVSRTIADLEGSSVIRACHISEAIQYRTLDRRLN